MSSVGVLILFMLLGAFICAKARVAMGAVAFSLIALVLFVSTPIGTFVAAFDRAATPALNGTGRAESAGTGS